MFLNCDFIVFVYSPLQAKLIKWKTTWHYISVDYSYLSWGVWHPQILKIPLYVKR